jgi:hypothetical protein
MIDSPHSGKYCFGKTPWQTFLGCVARRAGDPVGLRVHDPEPAGTVQKTAFEAELIILCVRWYLQFGLSFRNLEELMAG